MKITPRGLECWDRDLGVIRRARIQALQLAKYCAPRARAAGLEEQIGLIQAQVKTRAEIFQEHKQWASEFLRLLAVCQRFNDAETKAAITALNSLPFVATMGNCAGHLFFRYTKNNPARGVDYCFISESYIDLSVAPGRPEVEQLFAELKKLCPPEANIWISRHKDLEGNQWRVYFQLPGREITSLYVRNKKRIIVDSVQPQKGIIPMEHILEVLRLTGTKEENEAIYPEMLNDIYPPHGYIIKDEKEARRLIGLMHRFWADVAALGPCSAFAKKL
jgi:hypothetical protein